MNNELIIPRTVEFSEILRAADFLLVLPEETHTAKEKWFRIPKGLLRNFLLTNKGNVKKVSINISGNALWEHTFSSQDPVDSATVPQSVEVPFWKDLNAYESMLLCFTTPSFLIEPVDETIPFALDITFTPFFDIGPVHSIKHKLKYLYTLGEDKYLLVAEGACALITNQGRIRELEINMGEEFCQLFSKEERKEFYLKQGFLKDPKTQYKTRLTSTIVKTDPIDKFLFYVYTNNPETLQKDITLKEFAQVSDYVVETSPPALDITVSLENKEKFQEYMKEKYPEAQVGSGRQLTQENEIATARLRLEEMEKLTEEWDKILASADKVPKEITVEEFRKLPEDSEYRRIFKERENESANWRLFSMENSGWKFLA